MTSCCRSGSRSTRVSTPPADEGKRRANRLSGGSHSHRGQPDPSARGRPVAGLQETEDTCRETIAASVSIEHRLKADATEAGRRLPGLHPCPVKRLQETEERKRAPVS